ncbi:cilia- and flagella-associated protein 20 [Nephila pilipes]|uniref:Cilia- and flagella-associated protein 20 n=1 Tax=Nephila pilipes TaxID=299642 RepID=A0A8X6M9U3_NEPPI|nr:cilia- and flagella-associated protein 20 [Nephila pilipes]
MEFNMFHNRPLWQRGRYITLLSSRENNPFDIWEAKEGEGRIAKIYDHTLKCRVIAIIGDNICPTYITCPSDPRYTLGIPYPHLIFSIKYLKNPFTLEILVLDNEGIRRTLRYDNDHHETEIEEYRCIKSIFLGAGWNILQIDLADTTAGAFETTYVETLQVQIHAHLKVRTVYFSKRSLSDDVFPKEFRHAYIEC